MPRRRRLLPVLGLAVLAGTAVVGTALARDRPPPLGQVLAVTTDAPASAG